MKRGCRFLPSIILAGFFLTIFPLPMGSADVLDTTVPLIAYLYSDGDGDGLLAVDEINTYWTHPHIYDTDLDGLGDGEEINIYGTDPNAYDTDGDGLDDGEEVAYLGELWSADSDNDGVINLLDSDSDNDGILDGTEFGYWGALWNDNSADSDGLYNLLDPDSDNDGLTDGEELAAMISLGYAWSTDIDGDDLVSAMDFDSDNDGIADGWEAFNGRQAYSASDKARDSDGDGVFDFVEYKAGSNPLDAADLPVLKADYGYNSRGEVESASIFVGQ